MSDLQRGTRTLARGDLCGHRAVYAQAEAEERAAIVAHSIQELNDPDVQLTIVPIPGRTSSFAVPKFVYDAIQKAARR